MRKAFPRHGRRGIYCTVFKSEPSVFEDFAKNTELNFEDFAKILQKILRIGNNKLSSHERNCSYGTGKIV